MSLLATLQRLDEALRRGTDAAATLDDIAAHHDAIVSAVEDACARRHPDALRLVGAAARYWWMRGHVAAGRALTARALAAVAEAPPSALGGAHHAAGDLARASGDYAAACTHYPRAIDAWRRAADPERVAEAQDGMGIACRERGELDTAAVLHAAARDAFRATRRPAAAALASHNLAVVAARRGQYALAAAGHRDALAQRRRLGDTRGIASSLNNLGVLALFADRQAGAARALFEEALDLRRSLGDDWGAAASEVCLGWALRASAPDAARGCFCAGLAGFVAVGDRLGIAESLEGLAALEQDGGLLATAEGLREALGLPTPIVRRAVYAEVFRGLVGEPVALADALARYAR